MKPDDLRRRPSWSLTAWLGLADIVLVLGCLEPSPAPPPASNPARARARAPAHAVAAAVNERVLPSGLRLLLDEVPNASVAGVVSVVRGGSGEDPPGEEGLGHLVEHLTYRAVDPAAAGERPLMRWDRLTREAAAQMNGHTTPDCLVFYEFGPVSRLSALLGLESARLAAPLVGVDEAAFAIERRIIGSEHLVRADPRAPAWATMMLWPSLFPAGHPYARPSGGTVESRRRQTFADVQAYAARVFRPERITLLVTGPPGAMSLDAIAAALPASLRERGTDRPATDAVRPSAGPRSASDLPPAAGPAGPLRLEHRSAPLPRNEIWLAWTLPGGFGPASATEDVLQHWVDDDLQAKDVVREEHHILQIETSLQPSAAASALFVRILLADGADPERIAQVVTARVASLWARETSARETFGRLRSLYETERLLGEPGQLSSALNRIMASAFAPATPPVATDLKTADVARFAYQWLTRERVHATLFTPATAGPNARIEPAVSQRSPTVGGEPPAELVPGAASWNPADLSALVPVEPPPSVKTLANGLTIVTVRQPGRATVAWLGFRGGTSDAEPPLLVEMAQRVRPDARRALALHIVPLRGATRDLSFDAVEFPPSQLSDALAILFAKATSPLNDWPDREGLERLAAPIAAAEEPATKRSGQAFWRALFGDHPYARMVSADDLDRLTRSDTEAWIGRVQNVHNGALVVVGDVSPSEVERAATILSRQLKGATWIASPAAAAAPLARPAGETRLRTVITARAGELTDLRLGCLLPPMTTADRGGYELLARAVEARLNAALRIDQGDGYGVTVGYERLRGGTTYLLATTFLAEDGVATALGAIRRHWERWSRDGLDPGELNVARWRDAGLTAALAAEPNALALRLLDDWNVEPATVGRSPIHPDLARLPAARANALFTACKANAVLGLTGSEPLIRRALAESWPGLATAAR